MINPKKLIKMARKWQKIAAMKRKRISLPRTDMVLDADCCSTSSVADKGHFVVYSADRRRFVIPLVYLNNEIFRQLLQMSEEEFGVQSEGPIILPCDSVFMDYAISFIQRGVAKDLERALIMSIVRFNLHIISSPTQGKLQTMCVGTEWLVHYVAFQIGPDMLCGFAQCSTLTLHAAPYQPLLEGPSLSMQHMALHPTKPNISLLLQGLSWGSDSMISPKKLIRMARKWQKVAALGRKRISLQRINRGVDADSCSTSTVADRGHLLFTALTEDALQFPWLILIVKSSESFFKCLRRSLGYKVQAPSYCRVIQSLWIM
ncbi:Auxin-responsive protein SAUR65 [Vitis vinifera]|uniref:Auxin-responsive protein SAUR65 n=1 Tax=Vitis vinifera TaxID=29760 RepID=A0A438JTC9_VITVI|nr:Auxin-responsive protein SAUR65 [Vitis vinifera]